MKKGIIFLFFPFFLFAEKISIGLGYPYLSLEYGHSYERRYEIRFSQGGGIKVIGTRLYHFLEGERLKPFLGGEVDYLWFKDNELKGKGLIGSLFIGGEISISRKVSILTDFSLCYIYLKAKEYSQEGLEPVVNMGLKINLR